MVNPKPSTTNIYLTALKIYCEWLGKTPTQLIDEADFETENIKLKKRRKINNYLLDFKAFLRTKDIAPKSISLYFTAILSFYRRNQVELPDLPREGRAEVLKENRYFLNKDEIWEALNVCDVLERAVVLTGVSSGLSAEEIIELKIREFKEGYDSKTEITTLKLRRQKTNVDFITFLTPEASRAVWAYLKFRDKKPKNNNARRIKQLEKQNIASDDGYLFILQRVPDEYLTTGNEELRKIKTKVFTGIYRKISLKAQKNTPEGCWNIIRSHNMRKFFNSTLKNVGADHDFVEYCMGHRLSDTKMAYYEGDPVKLRNIYQKYIPYLTIQKDLDISETPDYKRMTKEIEGLKAKLETETTRSAEMRIIKDSLDFIDFVKESDTTESIKQVLIDSSIKVRDEKLEELKKRKKPENIPSVLETEDNYDDNLEPVYKHELEDEHEPLNDYL